MTPDQERMQLWQTLERRQEEITALREFVFLVESTLPALHGSTGYDKIGAVLVSRAWALRTGKS